VNNLWPRLSATYGLAEYARLPKRSVQDLRERSRAVHPKATYAPTGGARMKPDGLLALATDMRSVAEAFEYPEPASSSQRIEFDRAAAELVYDSMVMSTVEAAVPGVWTFLALVLMPDVTFWRFSGDNAERWVASDLTRHMFARLWWQALVFGSGPDGGHVDLTLLRKLGESDVNQLLERTSIGGNPPLARAIARVVVKGSGGHRRVLRDIAPKLRRRLAFIDFSTLTDEQLDDHVRSLLG